MTGSNRDPRARSSSAAPPNGLLDPGTFAFVYGYSDGDPADMFSWGDSGVAAYLRFCILPSAGPGQHRVELIARFAHAPTAYAWYPDDLSVALTAEEPLVVVPGTVTVEGTPVLPSRCEEDRVEPEPQPSIGYLVQAPESVRTGEHFQAVLLLTTEVPLLGFGMAVTVSGATLLGAQVTASWIRLEGSVLFAAHDAAHFGAITGPGDDRPIAAGNHEVARLEIVAPDVAGGFVELEFSEAVHLELQGSDERPLITLRNAATEYRTEESPRHFDPVDPASMIPVRNLGAAKLAVQAPRFLRGDADRNGRVRLPDAVLILRHLFSGAPAPACRDAADVDDSGGLNLTDPVSLLRFLFGGWPEPPSPGPHEPGPDPTADGLDCSAPRD